MRVDSLQTSRFNRIYREQRSLIFNYLRRALGDAEEAEDATVETFRRASVNLPRFRGECSEKTWIMRIATTVAIRVKQQHVRRPDSLDALTRPDSGWEPADAGNMEANAMDSDMARWLLAQLPARQRQAVWLRVGLEFSDAEVAEILQVPAGTVKSWVWRSLAKLRATCERDSISA